MFLVNNQDALHPDEYPRILPILTKRYKNAIKKSYYNICISKCGTNKTTSLVVLEGYCVVSLILN